MFGGGTLKKLGPTFAPLVLLPDGSQGVVFDGIRFDGSSAQFSFGNPVQGIKGYLTNGVTVRNCSFVDIIDVGIKLLDGARLLAIGNRFLNMGENAIELHNYAFDTRTGQPYQTPRPLVQGFHRIIGNHFEKISRREDEFGIQLVDACGIVFVGAPGYPQQNLVISHNTFVDCLRAIWTEANEVGVESRNITITHNTILGNAYKTSGGSYGKAGIGLIGIRGGVVRGNIIRNPANYAIVGTDTCGIIISASQGVSDSAALEVADNVIVDDTGAPERTMYGIVVNWGTQLSIQNNQIRGMRTGGILLRSGSEGVRNTSVAGNDGTHGDASWNRVIALRFSASLATNSSHVVYPYGIAGDNELIIPANGRVVGLAASVPTPLQGGSVSVALALDGVPYLPLGVSFTAGASANAQVEATQGAKATAGTRARVTAVTSGATSPAMLDVTVFLDLGARP